MLPVRDWVIHHWWMSFFMHTLTLKQLFWHSNVNSLVFCQNTHNHIKMVRMIITWNWNIESKKSNIIPLKRNRSKNRPVYNRLAIYVKVICYIYIVGQPLLLVVMAASWGWLLWILLDHSLNNTNKIMINFKLL